MVGYDIGERRWKVETGQGIGDEVRTATTRWNRRGGGRRTTEQGTVFRVVGRVVDRVLACSFKTCYLTQLPNGGNFRVTAGPAKERRGWSELPGSCLCQ